MRTNPITVHLTDPLKGAGSIPFTFTSTDLTSLLIEGIQLGKLIATEERDLESIRTGYKLRSEFMENKHQEVMNEIERFYDDRQGTIDAINRQSELLIAAGQYEVAQVLLSKLIDMVASNSPLRSAMGLRDDKFQG